MKYLLFTVLILLIAMSGAVSAAVITYGSHNSPYEYSSRWTVWDQNIESESSAVTKSGSYTNFWVAPQDWGQGTWLFTLGSYVEVAFSSPADTLFAQFQSDANDGIAEFVVDGVSIGSINTFNRGWFQAKISGLTLGAHTLRIIDRSAHVALDNFGALRTSQIPEPAPLALMGLGLLGLVISRKKQAA